MTWGDNKIHRELNKFLKSAKYIHFFQGALIRAIDDSLKQGKKVQALDDGELGITHDMKFLVGTIKRYEDELVKLNKECFGENNG